MVYNIIYKSVVKLRRPRLLNSSDAVSGTCASAPVDAELEQELDGAFAESPDQLVISHPTCLICVVRR